MGVMKITAPTLSSEARQFVMPWVPLTTPPHTANFSDQFTDLEPVVLPRGRVVFAMNAYFAETSGASLMVAPLPDTPPVEPVPPDPQDDGLVPIEPGIKAKAEVNITHLVPELRAKFRVIFEAYQKYGYANETDHPMVLTSGNDSLDEHVERSYHKIDRAIDVRGKDVPDKILRQIAAEIQRQLGTDFRVLAEVTRTHKYWYKDHIHIEYHGGEAIV